MFEEAGERYVLAEARLAALRARSSPRPSPSRTVKGAELVGRRYTPLFPFFADTPNAFLVLAADFVSTEDGTGVVHLAPGFGEDDQKVCEAERHPGGLPDRPARPLHRRGAAVGRACRSSTPTPRSSAT